MTVRGVLRRISVLLLVSSLRAAVCLAQTAAGATPVAPRSVPAGTVRESAQPIAGRVVSGVDGHAIVNATLSLTPQQRNGRQAGPAPRGETVHTDSDGRYRFASQPVGRYTLRASAPGYLAALYLEHDGFSSAVVVGAGLATDNLQMVLLPEASLHGRVLDDTGEPVRASLMLYRDASEDPGSRYTAGADAPRIRPAGGAQADDDGRFEFTDLRPGRYYLSATATPWYAIHPRSQGNEDRAPYRAAVDPALDVAYPLTFYPHATTEEGAAPIVLRQGQRATANLLLQAEHAVRLTVQIPQAGNDPTGQNQAFPGLFYKVFGNDQAAPAQMLGRDGNGTVMGGLAPGQYVLRTFGRSGFRGGDGTPVSLSGGSSAVSLQPPAAVITADIAITLHAVAGEVIPDSAQVSLQRIGPSRGVEQPQASLDHGVAHFHSVQTGNYRIRVQAGNETWSVSRLTLEGKAVPTRVLRLDGTASKADVLASPYAPEVDGIVRTANARVHPGSLVVLVPAGADSNEDLFRVDQSDLDGGFQFANVLPGNYLLVALDNAWHLDWRNTQSLMPFLSQALPVTITSSGPRVVNLTEAVVAQQR